MPGFNHSCICQTHFPIGAEAAPFRSGGQVLFNHIQVICDHEVGTFMDFEGCRIQIFKRIENYQSENSVELERTEKFTIEEPRRAFDFLQMELEKQADCMGISKDTLSKSNQLINRHPRSAQGISCKSFVQRLDYFLRRQMKADYKMGDIAFTSADYAFKAECDLPSVASIMGYNRAIKMFRHPEKYDLFERTKNRKETEYFDELYNNR